MATLAPRTIHASVGPKVLGKSAELFDQRISTILSELLQNARRAGATAVAVTGPGYNESGILTISDNGAGIESPEILLQFGGSAWDRALDEAESAAGMGFFSLAKRGCTVHSHDWIIEIPPDGFTGAVVTVQQAPERIGTEIRFAVAANEVSNWTVNGAARYLPIPVTYNGESCTQQSFLENAKYTREVMGVRIGIYDGDGTHDLHNVNFHGHYIKHNGFPVIRYANRRHNGGAGFHARVDVIDAPGFSFVLPTRDRLQHTPTLEVLNLEIYKTLLAYCAGLEHQLAFKDFHNAQKLGIAIAPPALHLTAFVPDGADDRVEWPGSTQKRTAIEDSAERTILRPGMLTTCSADVLATVMYALEQNAETAPLLVTSIEEFEGYEAYDAISEVCDVEYRVTANSTTYCWVIDQDDIPSELSERGILKDVTAEIVLHARIGEKMISYPVPATVLLLPQDDLYDLEEFNEIILTPNHSIRECLLSYLIVFAYWCSSDSREADCWETQNEWAGDCAYKAAMTLLYSAQEAYLHQVQAKAAELRALLNDSVTKVEVTKDQISIDHDDQTRVISCG